MLITSIGRNTRKPTAAARPMPSAIDRARSPPDMCGSANMPVTIGERTEAVEGLGAGRGYTRDIHVHPAMLALVREVSPQLARCELTHLERVAIDVERAVRQHQEYAHALETLGCALEWLAPLPECADSVFVEDTAV